jgi:hypothetical protein
MDTAGQIHVFASHVVANFLSRDLRPRKSLRFAGLSHRTSDYRNLVRIFILLKMQVFLVAHEPYFSNCRLGGGEGLSANCA